MSKFGTQKESERKYADLEYELNHGLHGEPSKMTWEQLRSVFMAEYAVGLRPRTQDKMETVFNVFEQIVRPASLSAINERTLSRFLKGMWERKHSGAPHTMRNYLATVNTVMTWTANQKFIPMVPKFPTVRVPKKKPQPYPPEVYERLIEKALDDLWRAFLMCGWWAGLRLSEAQFLHWEPSEKNP